MFKPNNAYRLVALITPLLLTLSGCNPAFHDLGIPPTLSAPISDIAVQTVLEEPYPLVIRGPQRVAMDDNAIWNKREGIYFRDRRAYAVGDILTIRITMDDSAKLKNRSGKDTSLNGTLKGAGTYSTPKGYTPKISVDGSLAAKLDAERGDSVNRTEKINLQLAAVVIGSSANGNLQIQGTQEVRVNHELRILTVQGVVRSKDISPDNTIAYEKIAEARISYGGSNTRPRVAGRQLLYSQTSGVNNLRGNRL